jgi:hypothetical protein
MNNSAEYANLLEKVFNEAKASKIYKNDFVRIESLYEKMFPKYKNFAYAFPVVFRWTIQRQEFDRDVALEYFTKTFAELMNKPNNRWNNSDEWYKNQTFYLELLFKKLEPELSEQDLKRRLKFFLSSLRSEERKFKNMHKEACKVAGTDPHKSNYIVVPSDGGNNTLVLQDADKEQKCIDILRETIKNATI